MALILDFNNIMSPKPQIVHTGPGDGTAENYKGVSKTVVAGFWLLEALHRVRVTAFSTKKIKLKC